MNPRSNESINEPGSAVSDDDALAPDLMPLPSEPVVGQVRVGQMIDGELRVSDVAADALGAHRRLGWVPIDELPAPDEAPAKNASTEAWQDWAISLGADPAAVADMHRDELVAQFSPEA